MDELITARYRLTVLDYVEVCVANHPYLWRSSPILKFAGLFFGGLLLLAIVGLFVYRGGAAMDPIAFLTDLTILLMFLGALAYLFHPRNLLNRLWYRHNFRSIPEGLRSIEWGFDRETLWARTPLVEGNYRWELFPTIVETPKCLLFYSGQRRLTLWLPSHGFSSPGMLRTFTDLAGSRIPHYVVLGACIFPAKPEPVGLDEL